MAIRDSIRKALLESCLYNPSPPPTFVDYGCMDPTATNYEPSATHPCDNVGPNNNACGDCFGNTDHCGPGTYPGDCCDYPATVNGCTDLTACNYDPLANTDDGTCTYPGCIDPAASNYNSVAGCSDGSCTYDVLGCIDPAANNYDPLANIDDGGCTYDVLGCTDSTACNYDSLANIDDGSCCYDQNGDPCTGTPLTLIDVVGCMTEGSTITITWAGGTDCDNIYLSYNSGGVAIQTIIGNTTNTGSYSWTVPTGLSPTTDYYFYIANDIPGNPNVTEWDYGNDWNICGMGCTDPGACNYDATANIDDGSCEYTSCEGCIDPNAINYDPTATIDDNSCVYSILGCTDPLAFNYDPLSTVDDGSCVYNLEPCCEWCASGDMDLSIPEGCEEWMCNNNDYCPPLTNTDNPCDGLIEYLKDNYSNWSDPNQPGSLFDLDPIHFCEKCKYEGLNDRMCKCCKKDPCDKNVLYYKLQQEYNIELPEFCKYCKDGFIQDVSCKCCKKFEKIKKKKPRKKRKKIDYLPDSETPIDKGLMGEEIKRIKELLR